MDNTAAKDSTLTAQAILAIHLSWVSTLKHLLGPRILDAFGSLQLLDPTVPSNPYLAEMFTRASVILEASPEFGDLLAQDGGLERAIELLHQLNLDIIGHQRELLETRALFERLADQFQDSLREIKPDGEPPLGAEVEVNADTISREPWRLKAAIPPSMVGLSEREWSRLELMLGRGKDDTDASWYVQVLLPILMDTTSLADTLTDKTSGGLRRKNSRLWELAGTLKPGKDRTVELGTISEAFANVFQKLSTLEGRREMVGYLTGVALRRLYGLSKGQNTDSFFEMEEQASRAQAQHRGEQATRLWEPEDAESARGYEDVDARMVLEAIHDSLAPAQKEALEMYLEAEISGRTIANVARAWGKDPNLVRNNFQALKRKVNQRHPLS